ncbi:FG-GAP-like repeat-containing protein [Coleofasciculus sp. G2-EDA-02]|uniref:FG-GAP-like repeat-containing protein n=1 Tax=Coleofasciculus sp. G2-EDA-02 TaxID=3069529 RepID=UPI0032FBEC3C
MCIICDLLYADIDAETSFEQDQVPAKPNLLLNQSLIEIVASNQEVETSSTTPTEDSSISATTIRFEEVTNEAGISYAGLTYGSAWGDFNGDKFPDIWVNNHFNHPGILYLNQKDGTFTDATSTVFLLEELTAGSGLSSDHHGATWVDFDNDGDQDLLQLVGSPTTEPNLLFVNEGGVLRDRATELGLAYASAKAQGPIWFDFDNDGLLDLFHGSTKRSDGLDPTTIFRQTSNGFENVGSVVVPGLESETVKFGILSDLSGDGNLDLVLPQNKTILDTTSTPFTDITSSLLSSTHLLSGSDVISADLNGDLLPDLYLTGRGTQAELGQVTPNDISVFFRSNGDEKGVQFNTTGEVTFKFALASANKIFIGSSGFNPTPVNNFSEFTLSPDDPNVVGIYPHTPGVDQGVYIGYDASLQRWQIFNSINREAILVEATQPISELAALGFNPNPSFPSDRLLINTDQGLVDVSSESGINNINSAGNSVTAGDFDNDMDVDLYIVATGSALNRENILLENQGDGTFIPVSNAGGAAGSALGLGDSVTAADYNLDGFLDLFVTNGFVEGTPLFSNNGPHQLFRNQGNGNNWLQIDLEGTVSNRDGIGARVFVTAGGVTQLREQSGGIHKWAQNHQRIHFGLAENTQVDLLEIHWPSGIVQTLENISANQLITVLEADNSGANTAPIAIDDDVTTNENTPVNIDVLSNDSDAEADVLSLSILTPPTNGTAVVDDNDTPDDLSDDFITYTPAVDFTGTDQFVYQVDDLQSTDTATVNLTINPLSNTSIRIEAEDYASGGQGISYYDTTKKNFGGAYRNDQVDIEATSDVGGGYNIGWTDAGEWLTYNFTVPKSGLYNLVARVASGKQDIHSFNVTVDGQTTTLEFDKTGDWQSWQNVVAEALNLSAGSQQLQLDIINGVFNLNYLEFIPALEDNTINGTAGDDTLNGTAGDDIINGFNGRDILKGADGKDILNGGDKRDVLHGAGGEDILNGDAGNDNLNGGFSDDILNGGLGNDLLIGGFGNDTLTGGEGSDRFRFFRTTDGVDTITDFSVADDIIQVKGEKFGGDLVKGVLGAEQFVLGTTALDSEDRFIYDQSTGNLFFDIDGAGGSDQRLLATLSNQANISFADIVVF